jgi:hypothetical protein
MKAHLFFIALLILAQSQLRLLSPSNERQDDTVETMIADFQKEQSEIYQKVFDHFVK